MSETIILYEDEYCWILDRETGRVSLAEGGARLNLTSNQTLACEKRKKIILAENEFIVVNNPYDQATKRCRMGEREVREGPRVFSLYPSEEAPKPQQSVYILKQNEGVKVQALSDHAGKKAGQTYIIAGPAKFIPNKYEIVKGPIAAINVPANRGIYVRDMRTSVLRLEEGPMSFLPAVHDEIFERLFSDSEAEALGLAANEKQSYWAPAISMEKRDCVCVLDSHRNIEKYITGPKVYLLGPYESVKILDLSAGNPKKENQMKVAKIHHQGVDFMTDSFQIRTADNALLDISLSYKWQFLLGDDDLPKIFALDFIGYPCQSLRSRIREESAKHDFEKFHNSTAEILRSRIFKDYEFPKMAEDGSTLRVRGRFFPECCLMVSDVDIKEVKPVDEEIASLMNESLRSNMNVLCVKAEDKAKLTQEKERIEAEREIACLKTKLIENQNINLRKETIERAIIEGAAEIEKAKSEREAFLILERGGLRRDIDRMRETITALQSEKGAAYLELLRMNNENVQSATIVPADCKTLMLPPNTACLVD